MLSKVDVWNHEHYVYSAAWDIMKIWMIFHLKKFKSILKERINLNWVKISLTTDDYPNNINRKSPDYFSLRDDTSHRIEIVWAIFGCGYIFINLYTGKLDFNSFKFRPDILFFTPIIILVIFIWVKYYNFVKKRPFVMLEDDQLVIAQNSKSTYNIQKIPYSNIEKIEVDTPGSSIISIISSSTFYIKLKNRKNEKSVHGLKDWDGFFKAVKRKRVDAYFTSSNEVISK